MRSLFAEPWFIGVIGARKRHAQKDFDLVRKALLDIYEDGDTLVSGGCPQGGDAFAERLKAELGAPLILHLPNKALLRQDLLEKNPRAAYAEINYARNTLIARDAKDCLIACVVPDSDGGTEDTIKKWKRFHPTGRLVVV